MRLWGCVLRAGGTAAASALGDGMCIIRTPESPLVRVISGGLALHRGTGEKLTPLTSAHASRRGSLIRRSAALH